MTNEDPHGFPQELCCKPVPFIGLSGLDTVKNPTHRFIWDAFSKNVNHLPLLLKIIPPNHQFPVVKPKKPSFDRYIPKGILKKNWMKKHLLEIPAVVAVLFDLDWDDPNWEIQKKQCVLQVKSVRSQLGSLASKMAVILIQKVAPLPSGEDSRGAERAAALCVECGIASKQLYVIPQDDHLQGYVVRLQNALLDLAKAYYGEEIKLIKSHKDHLTKATHRYLFVRHNFKMGFLSELKQEDRSARSFYEMAYSHVKEVRSSDSNLRELKVVAGFINYKLCAIMFRIGEPRDALTQLRGHIKLYKPWVGPKELLFEHYAWLAVQYAAFSDLFDEAIRQGLSAMQTEHPGIYYRQAALYTIDRKLVARELCQGVTGPPPDLALTGVEFWGQRGWRSGKLSELDSAAERDGVRALQAMESAVDHSALIIGYLGNAISQFKTYRCPRMRLQLLVQMAEEYHAARDHGKALTLLSHMLSDYRNEKWWQLLATLLQLGLSSAYLSANITDYVTFAVEALSPHIPIDSEVKLKLFQSLLNVLNGEVPTAPVGVTAAEISHAETLWAAVPHTSPVVVDMAQVRIGFSVRVGFTQPEFQIGQPISVRLSIKSFCPGAIQISSMKATLTSDSMSVDVEASSGDVTLDEGAMQELECSALCPLEAGQVVRMSGVTLTLANKRVVILKLLPVTPSSVAPSEFLRLRTAIADEDWGPAEALPTSACIAAPKAAVTLDVSHISPALLGEQFPIGITVTNRDAFSLYHAVLEVKLLAPGDDSSPYASTRLSDEKQTSISPRSIKVLLDTIPSGTTTQARIFLKGYSVGDRTLGFTLTYSQSDDIRTPSKMASAVTQETVVPVAKPFEIAIGFLTTKFEPASKCYAYETFLLSADMLITAPCPIVIHHSTVELGLLVANECQKLSSQLAGVTLYPGEIGSDIFPLKLIEAKAQPVAVGTYVLQWSREGSDIVTSSSITLPAVTCLPSVLSVAMSLPAYGRVRTPMTVEYTLYNRTSTLLQLDMHIDANEAFMFAGPKQALLRLLPESERKLEFNLHPLLSGLLALPRLVLSAPDLSDELSSVLERNLPTHVYVMPQEKNSTTASL